MAALRFSHQDESQVDPFTAGEPELPGGEPDRLDEAPDELPGARPDYAPHGDPTGQPHKPDDNYQAPTTRSHAYDAPSTDEPSVPRRRRRARASRPAPGQADEVRERTRRDRHVATTVILALVLLVSFGSSIVSCAASVLTDAGEGAVDAVQNLGETLFGDDSDDTDNLGGADDWRDYVPEQDEGDRAATEALQARLDQLDPGQGPTFEQVRTYFEQKILDVEGHSAEELGIDASAFARMVVGGISQARAEYAYDWGDGTATAYASISALDANDLFWALDEAVSDYLIEHDLWGEEVIEPTEEQRSYMSDALNEALEEVAAAEPDSFGPYGIELELVDDVWVVSEQSLAETLEMALSLY